MSRMIRVPEAWANSEIDRQVYDSHHPEDRYNPYEGVAEGEKAAQKENAIEDAQYDKWFYEWIGEVERLRALGELKPEDDPLSDQYIRRK